MASLPKVKSCPGGCGTMIEARVSTCRACYYAATNKAERNRQLFHDYTVNLLTAEQLAEKYELSVPRVYDLMREHHARIDPDLKRQRIAAKRALTGRHGGRPEVWPDCPPHLKGQYDKLRRVYGYRAAEARAILEAEVLAA